MRVEREANSSVIKLHLIITSKRVSHIFIHMRQHPLSYSETRTSKDNCDEDEHT